MNDPKRQDSGVEIRYLLRYADFSLDVEMEVPMRGITGVFGKSGAGKTSLLRCIAGLERASSGRLVVGGDVWEDTENAVNRPPHRREIGYVFQEPRLFGHLNVRANLEYGLKRARDGHGRVDFESVVSLLGLHRLLDRAPSALSGGEAQRVAIARALLRAPRFVLMDEPLAALDESRRSEVLPFLDRMHSELSIPIVYVSHSIQEIGYLCDQLVVLDEGRIAAVGKLQTVLTRTDLPQLAGDEAGSVLQVSVRRYDDEHDLTLVSFSGGAMWIPGRHRQGSDLRIRIKANDVSLSRDSPVRSTILNVLPAVIEEISTDAGPTVLLKLKVGSDRVVARVTRRSRSQLDLKVGDELLAQIKSVAVRNVPSA